MTIHHYGSLLTAEMQSEVSMPRKFALHRLIVICITILLFTLLIRDSLCELRIKKGNTEVAAFLNYELKS
ncbi:toxin HokB [Candidatus Regiella insecticola]|uniref:Toxin HokB n=2 Tax=Candidatus Regiella insecticola TaxID=138073 RepID=A0A6L2ZQR6_9ENTR|nr:toxin HokB [Candidatus Regiella insecticola]